MQLASVPKLLTCSELTAVGFESRAHAVTTSSATMGTPQVQTVLTLITMAPSFYTLGGGAPVLC